MANKLQAYAQLADHTAAQVTTSYQAWTAFLRTAGRLYKYPFPEQLLIYAQRPDATACAEYDFWNERMRRYVRRGSTGIALIDNSGGKPFLRYVFDVADTGGEDETRPQLWKYREEHRETVSAALERRFDVPIGDGSLPEQLEKISVQFMADYWREHQQDILGIVDGSFLEEYDAYNIGVQFKNAAAVSMTYVLLSRCGLEAKHFFHHEDFLNVFDFNTPDTLTELGTAVSQGSEAVLRQIEVAIKKYERERSAERSAEHGERADIHEGGGLPASQPDPGGAAGPGSGQVREDAPDVSEGASSGAVQPPDAEGDAVPPPAGDRGRGQQPDGADDAGAGESGGGHGAVEGQRPHEVGGADEQLQGPGGGDHPGGADLQLTSIPSEQEQIKAIEEGLSAEAPGPSSISQADIDAVLRQYGGRLRIFTMYQHGISAKDAAAALKKEYGYSGHNYTFPDGASGMVKYSPDTGLTLQCYQPQAEVTVKWPALEKRVRQLIQEGSYLTPEELEKYESDHLEDVPEQEADVPVPAPAPASLDVTDMDVDKVMTDDWGAQGRKQRIFAQYQTGRSDGEIADFLRNEYLGGGYNQQNSGFVTLADGGRGYSYFVYKELRLSLRDKGGTMRHITFEELAGRIRTLIDQGRYLTPEELEQTALTASESTVAHGPEAAPPVPATVPPREITPADIDAALQEWNGDMDSKRRVQQYMTDHARDRATAEWLKNEYGDDLPAFPVTVEGAATDLPWTKVQRRLALLVKEDRFFTQAELDNFEDIDPAAIREQLENGGPSPFVEQVIADVERLAGQEAEQDADAAPTVREIYEKYKPIVKEKVLADQAYQNACKNSDRETALMEGREAVNRAALSIIFPDGTTAVIGAEDFMRLYFDMADFRLRLHREVIDETYPLLSQAPDLSGQPVIREGDTLTVGSGDAAHEVDITVSDEEWQAIQDAVPEKPPRDPLAPAYQPGDNKTAYEINAIGLFDVELQDPAQTYPVFRSESKERFETLLWQDARNGPITEFLPANLERVHDYFREALTSGLLTDQDKQRIASWLRSGLGNTPIGNRLAEQFADRAETIQLITGETADYFTSTTGIEVKVHDKFSSGQYMGWALIPSVLRALWQQELDGFTHEPVQLPAVHLEGRPAYQVGDKVTFPYGDREISGTIGWIGENSVRLDVGPYSWSHETINRDAFEDALRHDERNAALFAPEAPPAQEFTTQPVTVYPAEPNNLPFEIVVERLKVPEQVQEQPEQAEPAQSPATRNFRIIDDDLGVGTQKEKFRRNMEAINTLQGIELEGRSATPAEQEILSQYVGWGGLPDAFDTIS